MKALPKILVFDDITLDLQKRQIEHCGTCHELSPREFKLMAFLMKRAGKVLTRQALYKAIYGKEMESSNHTIKDVIKFLRGRLGEHQHIENIWGHGYTIVSCSNKATPTNQMASQILEYGDIRLDVVTRIVLRGSNVIPLENAQYNILAAFIRNAGDVLAPREIYGAATGAVPPEGWDYKASSLRAHIYYLRKALGGPNIIENRHYGRYGLKTLAA